MIIKVLLAAALVGCAYDTRFEDCTVHCADATGCPGDLMCGPEGLCRSPGADDTCSVVFGVNPSCVGLATTCGPNADEDCCSIGEPIPGGTFYRSYDVAVDGMYPSTGYPATVSPFMLDRFEITVGRFRKFVEAGMGTQVKPPMVDAGGHPNLAGSGWSVSWNSGLTLNTSALITSLQSPDCTYGTTWTDTPGANEDLPINCITWFEMMAFCIWDEGYLPTEAEWNYAASGGMEQRVYPWSNPPDSAVIDCSYANYDAATCAPGADANRVGRESPKGDGKWGQADLGGNLWEQTLDWYATPYSTPCNDCATLSTSSAKVDRGGAFTTSALDLRGAARGSIQRDFRRSSIGARCARPDR